MDCNEARLHLRALRRGRLDAEVARAVGEHLATCEACRAQDRADGALDELLAQKLARPAAPAALKRALTVRWGSTPPPRSRPGRALLAMAGGAALASAVFLAWPRAPAGDTLAAESVSDHLRILGSQRPLEVESGEGHQVKPWFAGRVDFAPRLAFAGDEDFPLQGGAVAYFVDRKAAAYVFKRRLHTISLFVFRAEGLPWPARPDTAVGHVSATATTSRGYNVLLWRLDDLGYALVSDLDARELIGLGAKIAGD